MSNGKDMIAHLIVASIEKILFKNESILSKTMQKFWRKY